MIIEILDRKGQVTGRHKLYSFPVKIGRAYSNDLIVSDPRVDPNHALIHADEAGWRYEDRGSANGSFRGSERIETTPIASGNELRIGRSSLRFLAEEHPVAPPKRDGALAHALGSALRSPRICIAICLLAAVVVGISDFFGGYDEIEWHNPVSAGLLGLLLIACWAGPWAFANRSLTQESRFLAHSAIASAAIVITTLVSTAQEYVNYLVLPGDFASSLTFFVEGSLTFGLLLFAHLTLLSQTTALRRAAGVVAITLFTFGVFEFADWSEVDDFVAGPNFPAELKPLPASWLSTRSSEDFFANLDGLQERVDELDFEEISVSNEE